MSRYQNQSDGIPINRRVMIMRGKGTSLTYIWLRQTQLPPRWWADASS